MDNPLAAHRGTYRGLSPTDESAIAMGEAEIIITGDSLRFSLAAGHEIVRENIPAGIFAPMSPEEVAAQFKEGSGAPSEISGFKGSETGFPVLLFARDSLIVWTGGMGDILGPSVMVGPGIWPRTKFWLLKWILDFRTSGGFPRFLYGGKTRRYA